VRGQTPTCGTERLIKQIKKENKVRSQRKKRRKICIANGGCGLVSFVCMASF
jgi:hypothetical protein